MSQQTGLKSEQVQPKQDRYYHVVVVLLILLYLKIIATVLNFGSI